MESVYKIGNIGDLIKDNSYVGRGVVIGESENGKNAVFAYFIMGRSENSRNRIFKDRGKKSPFIPLTRAKWKILRSSSIRPCAARETASS